MFEKFTYRFSMTAVFMVAVMLVTLSCEEQIDPNAPQVSDRTNMPILKSQAVSMLISDSGRVRYKIIAEDWYIYDQKSPSYWAFEKGLFIEQFDKSFNVEAFISCDTAYNYDVNGIWELRGRVVARNTKGETFKTSLLFWNTHEKRFFSDRYMEIDGIEQDLAGYDFSANESMTEYKIHRAKGAFPIEEKEEEPVPEPIQIPTDSTAVQ